MGSGARASSRRAAAADRVSSTARPDGRRSRRQKLLVPMMSYERREGPARSSRGAWKAGSFSEKASQSLRVRVAVSACACTQGAT